MRLLYDQLVFVLRLSPIVLTIGLKQRIFPIFEDRPGLVNQKQKFGNMEFILYLLDIPVKPGPENRRKILRPSLSMSS